MKLSKTQRSLLIEMLKYNLAVLDKKYYRLGGHGNSSVRYHPNTLYTLKDKGYVSYDGFWYITPEGQSLILNEGDK